nr:T9SS type A sorting domain-containing protein [Catalimonadaceae bacterium]
CGTASSTYTITRKVAPASTFTRFSTNFPAPVAGVYCLRKNTAYTFQLSGGTNVPPNVVSAGNAGLPTALGTWSWAPGSNIMTLTTPSTSGTATAYTVGLNNITCAGGNINVPDQYRLATDQPYTFAITPAVTNCGNFQVRATGFPITCPNALFYTWSVSPGSVVIVGIPSGCGVQNVQIDPTTVPVGGCTISCTVSATGCIIPGTCTVCQNFIVTNPTPFIVPNNSQPYLAGCRPGPGGENPKSALRAATDPDFEIDPNPTSVSLSVKLNSGKNQESTVSITDVSGKQVLSATKDSDEFTLDVSSLSKGVYIISINNSNGLKTKRFVKN